MYIRMTQNCDRVVVLKSVSLAVAAFDANGDPLKGVRKSTTIQIASFDLLEPIAHAEIPLEQAVEFESWRFTQISRIHKAFIDAAAAGKLGGTPVLKTRTDFGDPQAKVGEFSGIIHPVVEVQTGLIKSAMSSQKRGPAFPKGPVDGIDTQSLIQSILEISSRILRHQHRTGFKGDDLYTVDELLDIRAAWCALGASLEDDVTGQGKIEGPRNGRIAAREGRVMFKELRKSITG
ncbi:hypothetical protein DJ564_17885 [Pseudomonas sp. 31-12]|uniref:hypothetical protein n=1 Tax=Pseudomonas sp. 31-12 TaxID=2201356 RepID=UPI000D6D0FD5|nr:hypothetical protein [Pseudomonas sp. 31-12]AWM92548.1 hypothetical protein DJ564_17885 [Pseudomonas sp. 31-12]